MPLGDIEPDLTDVEREIRDTVHKFAAEVVRPAGEELDKLADPAAVSAKGSVLWDVFRRYDELGVDDLAGEDSDLTEVQKARVRAIVNEEIGWGDAGLAISLSVRNFHKIFVGMSGNQALIERYGQPKSQEIGCWAITEPDHGSDTLASTEPHFSDPAVRANCIARKDGDEYVIRGQKAAWVSNGTIATVAALFCTIDGDQGFKGGGIAVVPLDQPGVSKGKALDKIGQRALDQGEIFFDDARIPADYMIVGKEAYPIVVDMVLTMANSFMGATFAGVGRAAAELAIDYAKERVQGGVPIIQHQSVKARLFDMFRRVEAARAFSRKVLVYNSTQQPPLLEYAIASKTFTTNTAFEVASAALQIFGGNGLSREYPIEKIMRDARASMIEDGCNEVLSLVGASKL